MAAPSTLIQTIQCKAVKNLEKRTGDVDKKIFEVSGLVTTVVCNKKICEDEDKIPEISSLATTAVLNTKIGDVENKIPDLRGLVKRTDYDPKKSDIEGENFTTSDYNTFFSEIIKNG